MKRILYSYYKRKRRNWSFLLMLKFHTPCRCMGLVILVTSVDMDFEDSIVFTSLYLFVRKCSECGSPDTVINKLFLFSKIVYKQLSQELELLSLIKSLFNYSIANKLSRKKVAFGSTVSLVFFNWPNRCIVTVVRKFCELIMHP